MTLLRILATAGNATTLISLIAYYSSNKTSLKGFGWFFILLFMANIIVTWR